MTCCGKKRRTWGVLKAGDRATGLVGAEAEVLTQTERWR